MKRGGSRSFRTLGSRMRAFGRSLMRHYVPPQDMPALDDAPGWQSAAETPLLWPEAPAPNAAAAEDQTEYFDAPEENISPAVPRQRPAPTRPAPAAPPPAQAPVQRRPAASNKGVNPVLFDMLAKHDVREAERQRIRNEKKFAFDAAEVQRQTDPYAPPIRRRGRMSVDYVETGTLAQGDDTPPRPAKPAASEPPAVANEVSDINPVQRQPQTEADDGAEIFEDWNTDDDDVGDDDNGGTPPSIDPAPTPLSPPGIAQRFPDESSTFTEEDGGDFEVASDADYPQNFADVSVPPSAEVRRPQQVVQRDFQPTVPEAVDDADYYEADMTSSEDVGDYGYEVPAAPETFSQPPSQPIQRDYQPAAPDVPTQATFQQPDFDDAEPIDGEYVEDGDTRPMPIQRAPDLPPPTFDNDEFAPADETGYDSLGDWVDAHSDPVAPTAPASVQREYQSAESADFDVADDDGAGDGDTRPMAVPVDYQPLPSPFAADVDFETFDEAAYTDSPAPESSSDVITPPTANIVQRQTAAEANDAETFTGEGDTFDAEADDFSDPQTDEPVSEQHADVFNPSVDTNPVQRQAAPEASYTDENFVADPGDYDDSAPEYDDEDYGDFDAPEQRRDENIYSDSGQPEIGAQAVDRPTNTVQRQPDAAYDDNFALENNGDYEADAGEYAPPNYNTPSETAYDDFNLSEQRQDEGIYSEYNAPEADNRPDFAPPRQAIQRQPEASYDESYIAEDAGEFSGEAEEYALPVYDAEAEADANEYNPPEADAQALNTPDFAPPNTVQRQSEMVYDEPYAAENTDEFVGEAEEYVAPVYGEAIESDSSEYSPSEAGNATDITPPNTVQRQPEAIYDDADEFDVNDYAAPLADNTEYFAPEADNAPDMTPPTNVVQRQPAAPEMVDDGNYGDIDAGEYVDETGDYTYHRRDEGSAITPDNVPPTNTVQRQPETVYDEPYAADAGEYVDEADDSSLYDSNYQAEPDEFVPAARNIDAPFSPPTADPVQRAEQPPSLDTSRSLPPQFYGDDVYETDISALLGGQPDPRPVQRRAEMPDDAPQIDDLGDAEAGDTSVDLYQAMLQTGMVTPDGGFDSSHVEAAPPSIQRAGDDQADSPPLDLFQAMMETGMVQAERDDDFYEADDAEPMSAATRMDLLSLLDTPPTPRANLNQPPAMENVSSQVYQPPTQMVQRALSNEENEQPEQSEQSEKDADVNVDQLARDVYSVLRNRLRVERERRDHKS